MSNVFSSFSTLKSFMPDIYMHAVKASAFEIWVIRSEYKFIKFIACASFKCISS